MEFGLFGRYMIDFKADLLLFREKVNDASEFKKTAGTAGAEASKIGDSLTKATAGAKGAADGLDKTGAAAKRAMRPTTALNYTMLRLSQAFVNLRYGNPRPVDTDSDIHTLSSHYQPWPMRLADKQPARRQILLTRGPGGRTPASRSRRR